MKSTDAVARFQAEQIQRLQLDVSRLPGVQQAAVHVVHRTDESQAWPIS